MSAVIIRRRGLGMSSAKGIAENSQTGIGWVRNDKTLPPADVYIRWGCTSTVPTRKVINTAKAIHEVNDKAAFRVKCSEAGVSPKSVMNYDAYNHSPELLGLTYPVIVRPIRHAQGRNIHKCENFAQAADAAKVCGMDGYTSEYVDKVEEYRVCIAQGRVAWVVKKTPDNPEALAWNVSRGGRFDNVRWGDWPSAVLSVAIRAFLLSSLDFGGVDVMVDADGNATVLEINSAPSLTSPYRQKCMAKVFDWMTTKGKERMTVSPSASWKSYIHPAISDAAEV